jgi:hypothetical protein
MTAEMSAAEFILEEYFTPKIAPPQPPAPPLKEQLNAYYFFFRTTEEAQALEAKYTGWLNALPEDRREAERNLVSFFRKRNVVGFLYSNDREAREAIVRDEWGIQ